MAPETYQSNSGEVLLKEGTSTPTLVMNSDVTETPPEEVEVTTENILIIYIESQSDRIRRWG